jgi:hypothetical protein
MGMQTAAELSTGMGSHAGESVKELVKNVIKSLIHHEDHEGHEEKIKLINSLKLRALDCCSRRNSTASILGGVRVLRG